jgi:vitamin B12 transporter
VRNTAETAAELAFTSARFSITAGTGTSSTPGFGTTPSPRVGGTLQIARRTRLKATYGQAFSLPSFYSYAEPLIGNKQLRPERLKAWDAGVEQQLGSHTSVSATWFQDRYSDLINFSAAAFKLVNVPGVRTSGVEALVHWSAAKFEIIAEGSYLNWKIEGSNEPLRNQPHGRGNVSVSWRPSARLALGGDITAVGSAYDYEVPVPQIDRTDAHSTTSLHTQWAVRRNLEMHARVDNLFNQSFQQFVGFPDPGIRVRAGMAWTFSAAHGH